MCKLRYGLQVTKQLSITACIIFIMTACGGESTDTNADNNNTNTPTDTDGDGLTDNQEIQYGTSPTLADTDGFSDFAEINELGFNPDNNNFRFKPLIADVPKLRVEITSVSDIALNYSERSESETTDYDPGL